MLQLLERLRFGIQVKLLAGFVLVALLAIGSGAATWLFSAHSQVELSRIAGSVMPTMATAQMLTREAGVIAATASALASAPDEGERARLMETLSARAARLDRLLDDMRALGSDSRAIDEIQELAGRLTRTLDRQDMLVHRRLATRAELVRTIELLGRAHRDFLDMVTPRLDQSQRTLFDDGTTLVGLIRTQVAAMLAGGDQQSVAAALLESVERSVAALVSRGIGETSALRDLAAQCNLAAGLLNEAANTDDPRRLKELQAHFLQVTRDMGGIRMKLPMTPENQALLERTLPLLHYGLVRNGVFRLRERLLGEAADTANVVAETHARVAELGSTVDGLVNDARLAADHSSRELVGQLAEARSFQTAATLGMVPAALGLAWFYVNRRVVARILTLRRTMEAQARGEAVPIPIDGNDEITAMAQALRIFVEERRQAWEEIQTQRQDAEAARRRAEQANRSKSQFLAMMSHELRTPLNAIMGFSEMIRDRVLGAGQSDRYAEYAGHVHSSATHLLSLINDILDLSKVEAGKMELHRETIPIGSIVEAVLPLVRGMARDRGVGLSVDLPDGLAPIHADQRAMKQILVNLLSNAIKFTPPGGRIRLSCASAGPDEDSEGAMIPTGFDRAMILTVSDTGIGMDEDGLRRALEPFGQVDTVLNRTQQGTGLGLPMVKGLVELHGGSFAISSTPGHGTVVRLEFPPTRPTDRRDRMNFAGIQKKLSPYIYPDQRLRRTALRRPAMTARP